ncbi:hypothetical protein [Brevibacillus daliensis]|nr:hypothetical protein [Brevibacillus daliensis]
MSEKDTQQQAIESENKKKKNLEIIDLQPKEDQENKGNSNFCEGNSCSF